MKIWVDADACPSDLKGIICLAAIRRSIPTVLVANSYLNVPQDECLSFQLVQGGPDKADDYIAENCDAGDLVITADIPLADRIVTRGATGLDHRGELFTKENVKQRLDMRNFMEEMRSAGVVQGGPSSPTAADTRKFSDALDRYLTKQLKQ